MKFVGNMFIILKGKAFGVGGKERKRFLSTSSLMQMAATVGAGSGSTKPGARSSFQITYMGKHSIHKI